MTFTRKTWAILIVVLTFVVMPAAAYLTNRSSCLREPESWLVIENRLPTDVIIVNQDMGKDGEPVLRLTLGTVPAGNTEKLTFVEPPQEYATSDRTAKFAVASYELIAQDPAGNVVWQMSWSGDQFDDLAKDGQTIVIGPQPDSQDASQ